MTLSHNRKQNKTNKEIEIFHISPFIMKWHEFLTPTCDHNTNIAHIKESIWLQNCDRMKKIISVSPFVSTIYFRVMSSFSPVDMLAGNFELKLMPLLL